MRMTDKARKEDIEGLDFAVEKSMRYHQRRRGFYDRIHKGIMFVVVLSGSAAFYGMEIYGVEILAAVIIVLATFDLVWSPSHKARDHEMLFRRFSELAASIRTADEPDYDTWVKERMSIETNEPPIYWALEADCDNEVRRAWGEGRDKELVDIGWASRLTMNLIRHDRASFPMVKHAA